MSNSSNRLYNLKHSCWYKFKRSTDPLTKKGKIKMEKFEKVLNIDRSNEEEVSNFQKVFKFIDKDDDGKIDFPELMIFIFTIDENLSR